MAGEEAWKSGVDVCTAYTQLDTDSGRPGHFRNRTLQEFIDIDVELRELKSKGGMHSVTGKAPYRDPRSKQLDNNRLVPSLELQRFKMRYLLTLVQRLAAKYGNNTMMSSPT